MAPKYLVTEIQRTEVAVSNPTYAYDDRNNAEAKYHALLAGAAVSKVPVHSVMLFTDEGFCLESKCYKHEIEPEPVPETPEASEE